MKRIPLIPSLIVAAAVAAMIGLGIWQLHRAQWKKDLLALYQSEPYVEVRRAMLRHDASAVPPVCQRCVNFTGDRFIQRAATGIL